MGLRPTIDPDIWIEEQRVGYVRYVRPMDGLRWDVVGTCAATTAGPCMGTDIGPPADRLDYPVVPWSKCALCLDGPDPVLTVRVLP